MTSPPTRFLLIRHAESEWNENERWQGRADPPLSERGRRRAERAARSLREFSGLVFASPLRRAVETAEIIAGVLDVGPVQTEEALEEWDAGEWTGLTSAEIEKAFPVEFAEWRAGTLRVYPGGSDRTTYHEPVIEGLRRIAQPHRGSDLLVVTHAGALGSVERHLHVHPGVSVGHLEGRWFELDDELRASGDRIRLLDEEARA